MSLLDASLVRILASEFLFPRRFERIPEPDPVMVEDESVRAYAAGGDRGGIFEGLYLFHTAHVCELIRPGETVVDVGCGAAKLLLQLARVNPGVHFLGLDQSEPMLVLGREAIAREKLTNVELRRDDMTALRTVGDLTVDAVMSTFSLHQLTTRQEFDRVFTEVARVLKPGGGLYLADFAQLNSLTTIDEFVRMLMRDQAPRLTEDFANSLRAAFPKREYVRVTGAVLGTGYGVYTTAPSPFMVVVKNTRPRSTVSREKLVEASRELSGERLKDLKRLIFFFRLGGLSTPLSGV